MRIAADQIKKNIYVSFKSMFRGKTAWVEIRVTSVKKNKGSVTVKGVIPGAPSLDNGSREFNLFPDETVCLIP